MKGRALESAGFSHVKEVLAKAWHMAGQAHREKQDAYVSRLLEARAKQTALINRLTERISELEDRVTEARTESYADKVRGWIRGKEDFITKVQEQVDDLDCKIDSVRERQ